MFLNQTGQTGFQSSELPSDRTSTGGLQQEYVLLQRQAAEIELTVETRQVVG